MGEFSITIYTLAQTAPGLFAVNIAILTGHKLRGTKGSVVATIASFLPPFIIVLMLCKVYEKWKEYYMFKGIMAGLKPATLGLIGTAALSLATPENFIDWKSFAICIIFFLNTLLSTKKAILMDRMTRKSIKK